MQFHLRAFVLRLGFGLGLGLAGPMALSGQSACADLGCMGLSSLSAHGISAQTRGAHVQFDLQAPNSASEAFSDQVVTLVGQNLVGVASISSTQVPHMSAPMAAELSEEDVKLETADTALEASPRLVAAPDLRVIGQIQYQTSDVVELSLSIQLGQGESAPTQNLFLRADTEDWRSVAHYISDTLFTLMTDEQGFFHSHLAFVANLPGEQGEHRQLALVDQAGGDLQLISEAGNQAAHPMYLANQFELAFLDLTDGTSTLVHYNLLTGRLTPLLLLPDLQGAPALGQRGRFIAFSGLEAAQAQGPNDPTDIYVVDVQAAALGTIDIPGSRDREPTFAPNLDALAFVSSRESWNELLVAPLPGLEALSLDPGALLNLETQMRSLYGTPNFILSPAWSPDGQTLAFIEQTPEEDQLLLLDIETGLVEVLATGPRLTDLTWGPDVHLMALVVDSPTAGPGTLLRINLQQGAAEILPVPYPVSSPSWSSSVSP